MAFLYITEYEKQVLDGMGKPAPAALLPELTTQVVAITGASTQSAAVNPTTTLVRVHTDLACSIASGTNPTATTSKGRMAADSTEYFGVTPGQNIKIAVIAN